MVWLWLVVVVVSVVVASAVVVVVVLVVLIGRSPFRRSADPRPSCSFAHWIVPPGIVSRRRRPRYSTSCPSNRVRLQRSAFKLPHATLSGRLPIQFVYRSRFRFCIAGYGLFNPVGRSLLLVEPGEAVLPCPFTRLVQCHQRVLTGARKVGLESSLPLTARFRLQVGAKILGKGWGGPFSYGRVRFPRVWSRFSARAGRVHVIEVCCLVAE